MHWQWQGSGETFNSESSRSELEKRKSDPMVIEVSHGGLLVDFECNECKRAFAVSRMLLEDFTPKFCPWCGKGSETTGELVSHIEVEQAHLHTDFCRLQKDPNYPKQGKAIFEVDGNGISCPCGWRFSP